MLQYLLATKSVDIIAGNFNCNLLKVLENKFLDIFIDHFKMANKPTHISRSLIDHVYIMSINVDEIIFTNATAENLSFRP